MSFGEVLGLLSGLGPRAGLDGDVALVRPAANLQLEARRRACGRRSSRGLVAGLDPLTVDLDHQGRRCGDLREPPGCWGQRSRAAAPSSARLTPRRVLHLAVGDQVGRNALRGVAGHGIADARCRGSLRICAAMPTTLPLHVEHGTAGFPWFSAASVWTAFSIVKPLGDGSRGQRR